MSSSGRALEAGAEISETYRILEKLGEGGMGAVYLAEMIRLPKQVALKVLHVAADDAAKTRFRREAEIAATIRHPRIVEVLDYNFLEDGSPYLVMELLEGYDLRHRLDFGPCEPAEALPILRDIGSALECLHREGIVHRDLKPENIFLAKEGDEIRAKVLDFGISKMVGAGTSLTAEQTMLGTPAYMAPEQVTGQNATLDTKADQFALAAVAFEMLSGRPAFIGDNMMQLFHQILTAPSPTLGLDGEEASPADAVFAKALAKDRAARYPSVRAFILALGEALSVTIERFSAVDMDGDTVMAASPTPEAIASAGMSAESSQEASQEAARSGDRERPKRNWISIAVMGLFLLSLGAFGSRLISQETKQESKQEAASARDAAPAAGAVIEDRADEADGEAEAGAAAEEVESSPDEAQAAAEEDDASRTDKNEEPSEPVEAAPAPSRTGQASQAQGARSSRPTGADARRRLEEAEAALRSGDANGAIRHARASVGIESSAAARKILVMGYCELRDLGNAKAMARGIRGRELREARAHCESRGISL